MVQCGQEHTLCRFASILLARRNLVNRLFGTLRSIDERATKNKANAHVILLHWVVHCLFLWCLLVSLIRFEEVVCKCLLYFRLALLSLLVFLRAHAWLAWFVIHLPSFTSSQLGLYPCAFALLVYSSIGPRSVVVEVECECCLWGR